MLYYGGNTKFSQYMTDMVEAIYKIIESQHENFVLECIGPEELTLKKF